MWVSLINKIPDDPEGEGGGGNSYIKMMGVLFKKSFERHPKINK